MLVNCFSNGVPWMCILGFIPMGGFLHGRNPFSEFGWLKLLDWLEIIGSDMSNKYLNNTMEGGISLMDG